MESVFKDDKERIINKPEDITFSTLATGIYLIEVSARAKNEKQLKGTDDEDLRIEIDKRKFPQLTNPNRYFESPAAFNGGTQKGLKKTVYFLISLNQGKHTISLIPDSSGTFLGMNVSKVSEGTSINEFDPKINDQAEDGDRRTWITFIFVDLALGKFTTELVLKRRFIDSDDVKVIVDDTIKRNTRSGKLHKLWYFIASIFSGETQTETFTLNLPTGLHYIEFWADRMPTLKKINFSDLVIEENIENRIRLVAKGYQLDPELMVRVARKESQFDAEAISPVGAKGLFQLTDRTIKQIKTLGYEVNDPFDADQSMVGAMIYFNWLLDRYSSDPEQIEKTLAAWNWGLSKFPIKGPLDYGQMKEETRDFIKYVLNK